MKIEGSNLEELSFKFLGAYFCKLGRIVDELKERMGAKEGSFQESINKFCNCKKSYRKAKVASDSNV